MARIQLFAVLLVGCGVDLQHGLDERDANQLLGLLSRSGIAAEKQTDEGGPGRYRVVVPRADTGRAVALMEAYGLPRPRGRGLSETFAEASLVPSGVEERARLVAALQAELERTLERLPGVETARVHLALSLEDPLIGSKEAAPRSAAVLLRGELKPGRADEVRRLLAGAVPGLDPTTVQLVFAPAAVAAPVAPSLASLGPFQVAVESRLPLLTMALAALVLLLFLGVALFWTAVRMARFHSREVGATRQT